MGLAVNDAFFFLVVVFSCILYFHSGYVFTTLKSHWINYFGVCILGVVFWLICYNLSPNPTDYKRHTEAGNWLYYKLFVAVSPPLNFIDFINRPYNLNRELLILFFIPVIISCLQFWGCKVKIGKL